MTKEEILIAYKSGKLSTAQLQEKLREFEKQPLKYPLSEGQKGLWMLHKMSPEMSAYNVPICFRINGEINVGLLKEAFLFLVKQYPILSTVIGESNGLPFQTVKTESHFDFRHEKLSSLDDQEVFPILEKKAKEPFSLENGPLIRLHVFTSAGHGGIVLITVHHIIFDGSSSLHLVTTLLNAYRDLVLGKKPCPLAEPASYYDFVSWEQRLLAGKEGKEHLDYWKQQLSGLPAKLEIPTDKLRSISQGFEGKTYTCMLSYELSECVRLFARARRINLSVVFLGIMKLLLQRYTDQEDITVGITTMGRQEESFTRLIGYFINMIPVRSQVLGTQTFSEFLDGLQLTLVDALDHASYPFPALVRELKVPREPGYPPVFQTAFFYQNFLQASGLKKLQEEYRNTFSLEFIEEIHQEGEYELALEIFEQEEGFTLNIKYNPEVYESFTVERMVGHYIKLAEEAVEKPNTALQDFSLLSGKEEKILLKDWNATEADYPRDKCVHHLFMEQARKTPAAAAVTYEGKTLTYRELDNKSTLLAIYLQRRGIGPDCLVGICVERSLEMIVGLLGILKAGGAYVPLDPDYPAERLEYMIRDSQASLILTQAELKDKLSQLAGEEVHLTFVDEEWEKIEHEAGEKKEFERSVRSDHLAYVIYTSGSTGKPKGVMIPHLALTNFLVSMAGKPGLDSKDRLLAVTTYCFDIAGLEFYLPLIRGAQVLICSAEKAKDAEKLKQEIQNQKPTVMQATPVTWTMLFQAGWRNETKTKILCGGEALPERLKQYFEDTCSEVWNMFGPTETTIWSTTQHIKKDEPITIGRPIANTQIYILDKLQKPTPIGIPGELCIAGDGLARGYLNKPELTKEKFIPNPFNPETKLYKTGDLARWRSDGNIEFLGRTDHQIKIRGFRIELGEIESRLDAHPKIQGSVVIVKEQDGVKQLVAYYVQSEKKREPLSQRELRGYLKENLPVYMVPSVFIELDIIPLTPNGKINRKELMSRKVEHLNTEKASVPNSEIEEKVLKIWQDILHHSEISIDDGFFDVGGDSFLAVATAERISRSLNCNFDVAALFKYTNIKEIGKYIAQTTAAASAPNREASVHLGTEEAHNEDNIGEPKMKAYPEYYNDSLAVVGISCNLPGAKDHFEFWNNLHDGKESARFFSQEELELLNLPQEIANNPKYVPMQATIEDKDYFDPGFFNISPRDAGFMDPQFRLLLLHSWKALEDAGYVPGQIPETGVFMSASSSLYQALLPGFTPQNPKIIKNADEYVSWLLSQGGTIPTMISHKLGLKGPSFFIHSNCSSSLVGLYSAAQSIRSGEIQYALVGGATVFPTVNSGYLYEEGLNFSSDGHCKAFDASADGMVGGEGVAVIVLKKALDAVKNGDHVYAILRGIGINNDGADKVGFYAPSVKGQVDVIRKTLDGAKINPETIGYVEAHGTGTKLGDPIEFSALCEAYEKYTGKKQFCGIGSVKTNIGHLDTAAGLAGCIKVILSLYNNEIPPTINYISPNPNINLENSPFYVVDKLRNWEKSSAPFRAAVSSFGIGGTNAHAIFEQFITRGEQEENARELQDNEISHLFPLSAKNEERLKAHAHNLQVFLKEGMDLTDLAYTLQVGRESMESRVVFTAGSISELRRKLEAFIGGNVNIQGLYKGEVKKIKSGKRLEKDEYTDEIIGNWAKEGSWDKLAEAWVKGACLKWEVFYPGLKPRRISLPTYPFAKDYYGISLNYTTAAANAAAVWEQQQSFILLKPIWREKTVNSNTPGPCYAQKLVILCEIDGVSRESIETCMDGIRCLKFQSGKGGIGERFRSYALRIFEEIQGYLKSKFPGDALVQVVVPSVGDGQLFSGISGLLKTARLENPKVIGQLIELEPGTEEDEILQLLKGNEGSSLDTCIRYRKGKRYVSGWEEAATPAVEARIPWKDGGIYLITGGTGGLGLIFAREIARQVKDATLILVGRSAPGKDKQMQTEKLQVNGTRIQYRQTDVTRKNEVQDLIRSVNEEYGALNGIIHGAGVISDSFILKKSSRSFKEVLAPKVDGLINLDEASKSIPLDFFVLLSSISSSLGNPGQADYSTANAFMDAYAVYRNTMVTEKQREGLTLSVNWPLWQEGGMQINEKTLNLMKQSLGITPIGSRDGVQALYGSMAAGEDRIMVLAGDVPKIKELLLETVTRVETEPAESLNQHPDDEKLFEKTLYMMKNLFGEVIRLDASKIDSEASFDNYGVDSILVVQLNQKLDEVFEGLSKTLFYEYENLKDITAHLIAQYPQVCIRWAGLEAQAPVKTEAQLNAFESRSAFYAQALPEEKTNTERVSSFSVQQDGRQEPIAIIGISGRYPRASTLEEYWENLKAGKDCIIEIPKERWELDGFYHHEPQEAVEQGKSYSKWGSFLEGFADFDPVFFNISPREAINIDPQERLFIESCWEVLEDAGYTRKNVAENYKRRVGVFAGITKTGFDLYGLELWKQGQRLYPHTSFSSVANRVSYLLNLQGPSMPIDTMCASSLTAIHEACEHLYRQNCEMAIAGGVNLYLHPSGYIGLCAQQMLSTNEKCAAFGQGGNGFVPGEGVGCVLLKPLSRAERDGDHIYAVILGSSTNHSGRTNAYKVPSVNAQKDLILDNINKSGVDPRTISYVEAAANGSDMGDPIEVKALTKAFSQYTSDLQFCAIGSVKPNIGHLEAASGISQLTKVILQLQHRQLVPSIHAEPLNPGLSFNDSPFYLQRETTEWKRPAVKVDGGEQEFPRRAAISSFGAGGSNAHLIVQEYIPAQSDTRDLRTAKLPQLVVLSAKNSDRLRAAVQKMLDFLLKAKEVIIPDLAYTLQVGREAMASRLALVVQNREELIKGLKEYLKPDLVNTSGQTQIPVFSGELEENFTKADNLLFGEGTETFHKESRKDNTLEKLAEYWVRGGEVQWETLHIGENLRRISLPTYPFEKRRLWFDLKKDANMESASYGRRTEHSDHEKELNQSVEYGSLTHEINKVLKTLKDKNDSLESVNRRIIKISSMNEEDYEPHREIIKSILNKLGDSIIDVEDAVEGISGYLQKYDKLKLRIFVKETLCGQLNMKMEEVDMSRPLTEYGMDSVVLMDFYRRLKKNFDFLDIAAINQGATLKDIVFHIEERADAQALNLINLKKDGVEYWHSQSILSIGNKNISSSTVLSEKEIEEQRKWILGQLSDFSQPELLKRNLVTEDVRVPAFETFDAMLDSRNCIWIFFKTKVFGERAVEDIPNLDDFLRKNVDMDKIPIMYFSHYGPHFLLGGDRLFFAESNGKDVDKERFSQWVEKFRQMFNSNLPENNPLRVAVCAGTAQGGGFEFLITCDFQFVLPQVKLGVPEIKSNLYAGMGGLSYLASQVGLARTKLLNLTGGLIYGYHAYEMGLITHLSHKPFYDAYHLYEAIPNIKIAKHLNYRLNQQYNELRNNDLEDWVQITRENIKDGYQHILDDYKMFNSLK